MIGKIYRSIINFYDLRSNTTQKKSRPVLILSDSRNNDYTVLPISTVTKKENLDLEYDIELNPTLFSKLKLNRISYVRTHKRMVVHTASLDLTESLGDLKTDYPDIYLEIIEKMTKYNAVIEEEALS